jgi:hypothetical protein
MQKKYLSVFVGDKPAKSLENTQPKTSVAQQSTQNKKKKLCCKKQKKNLETICRSPQIDDFRLTGQKHFNVKVQKSVRFVQ